jgi:hypothetical protein
LACPSTDGYQGLFSFGEIFLAPLGERMIVSEQHKDAAQVCLTIQLSLEPLLQP